MARSFKEIVQCPSLLQWQSQHIEVTNTGLVKRDFDIKLGSWEAIDLYGIKWSVFHASSIADTEVQSVFIGLSVLEKEKGETEINAGQSDSTYTNREELLFVDKYIVRGYGAGTGVQKQFVNGSFNFPIPMCLIRPPTLELNVDTSGSGVVTHLVGTIYYEKRGVAKTVYLQLLKYWQDAKSFFKTGLPNEYDT